jgi:hypothetical protein
MEKSGCAVNSQLLNNVIRMLLKKGYIVKASNYISKADGNGISLEASTTSMLISLFSREGKYREHLKLIPAKYRIFEGAHDS